MKSPDATMRSTCAAALLQFLLDWPLQDHRLTQHLEFVLGNLSFELEDGRLQARALHQAPVISFAIAVLRSLVAGRKMIPFTGRIFDHQGASCLIDVTCAGVGVCGGDDQQVSSRSCGLAVCGVLCAACAAAAT